MNLDVYTQHIPLTQKARFWGNWVSALKGGKDMCAAPEPHIRHFYPSIVETMPGADSRLKNEFGRLEARDTYITCSLRVFSIELEHPDTVFSSVKSSMGASLCHFSSKFSQDLNFHL